MSMPAFPEHDTVLTGEEALNAILTSIALEETALSHILNAEGEKIQYAVEYMKRSGCDIKTILEVNESVTSTLEQIKDIEIILINKINKALKHVPHKPEPPPDFSRQDCRRPDKPRQCKPCPIKPCYEKNYKPIECGASKSKRWKNRTSFC